MGGRTRFLTAVFTLALLAFGGVADRALVERTRAAEEAASAKADERARLTALSARAALAQVEEVVVAGAPVTGLTAGRLAPSSPQFAPALSFVPYGKRPRRELLALRTSTAVTGNGLPEAVVAAIALGDKEQMHRAAERLLSGLIPIRPDDLAYLAAILGVGGDPRVKLLAEQLRGAPEPSDLPDLPSFRRTLSGRTIIGWSRGETDRRRYEIPVDVLLKRAGVSDAVQAPNPLGFPVPDVEGLRLLVRPEVPGRLLAGALRIILWAAVVTSVLALFVLLRALGREGRAVAREKKFLANVTHELRSPLAAIRLFGDTLAEGRGDAQEYGRLVSRESERLEALVERVLAVTRLDEAPCFTQVEPVDLVRSAVSLVAGRAEQRAVTVDWHDVEQNGHLPAATWDAEAVQRALLNLLDNAIKHGRSGGRVEVRARVEEEWIQLSVEDDGPGIARRDRKRIFGRFERGSTESPGTGLGLYVVEQVARAHGGRVELATEENRGCTFTLVLPRRPSVEEGKAPGTPS